jgi:hypothetical protein
MIGAANQNVAFEQVIRDCDGVIGNVIKKIKKDK